MIRCWRKLGHERIVGRVIMYSDESCCGNFKYFCEVHGQVLFFEPNLIPTFFFLE
jgi:hypothetical protein